MKKVTLFFLALISINSFAIESFRADQRNAQYKSYNNCPIDHQVSNSISTGTTSESLIKQRQHKAVKHGPADFFDRTKSSYLRGER